MGNTGEYLRDMPEIQRRTVSSCVCMVPITPQAQLEANPGKGGLRKQMDMVDRLGSGRQSPQPLAQEEAAGSLELGTEQR